MSGPREECGIVGVVGPESASEWAYLGLYALQHRGQESSGIVSTDGTRAFAHRAWAARRVRERCIGLPGTPRSYHPVLTTGSDPRQRPSHLVNTGTAFLAVATRQLSMPHAPASLERRSIVSDDGPEVIVHLIARSATFTGSCVLNTLDRLRGDYRSDHQAGRPLRGARSPRLTAARDSDGARPFSLDSCALDLLVRARREMGSGKSSRSDRGPIRGAEGSRRSRVL